MIPKMMYMGNKEQYIISGRHLKGMMIGDIDDNSQQLRERYWKEAARAYNYSNNNNWHLQILIDSPSEITRCVSISHSVTADYVNQERTQMAIFLKNAEMDAQFTEDFVLLYRNKSNYSNQCASSNCAEEGRRIRSDGVDTCRFDSRRPKSKW
jgi:hypothetical protein